MATWEYEQTVQSSTFAGAKYIYCPANQGYKSYWQLDRPAQMRNNDPDHSAGHSYKISTGAPINKNLPGEIVEDFFEGVTNSVAETRQDSVIFRDKIHTSFLTFDVVVPVKIQLIGYYEVYWSCIFNCEVGEIDQGRGVVAEITSRGSTIMWSGIPQVDHSISQAGKKLTSFIVRTVFKANQRIEVPFIKLDLTVNWNWRENVANVFDFFYSGIVSRASTVLSPLIREPKVACPQQIQRIAIPKGSTHEIDNHGGCFSFRPFGRWFKKKTKEKSHDPKPE